MTGKPSPTPPLEKDKSDFAVLLPFLYPPLPVTRSFMTHDVENPVYATPPEKGRDDSSSTTNGNWTNAFVAPQATVDPLQRKLKQRHIQM